MNMLTSYLQTNECLVKLFRYAVVVFYFKLKLRKECYHPFQKFGFLVIKQILDREESNCCIDIKMKN